MAWSFSVSPGVEILRINPGETRKVSYNASNEQKAPIKLAFEIKDSYVLPENKSFPASSWIEPLQKQVIVPPHGTKTVYFNIHAPQKASGELAGHISFVPEVKDLPKPAAFKPGEIQTKIVTIVTVSFYARIKGTEKGEADAGEVRVANVPSTPSAPAHIEGSVIINNTGNVHQRPGVRFDIEKKDGTPVHSLETPSGWPVMPRTQGTYKASVEGALPAGDYRVVAKVTFAPEAVVTKQATFTVDASGNTTNFRDLP